jgi:hypothetical protein
VCEATLEKVNYHELIVSTVLSTREGSWS